MSRPVIRLLDYVEHIREAIERINAYIFEVSRDAFLENQLLQDAVIRNLEIIGEASRNIIRYYPDFVETNTRLPFKSAYEMRNALAHGYFEVDIEIVWQTIIGDLPVLQKHVDELTERFANGSFTSVQ